MRINSIYQSRFSKYFLSILIAMNGGAVVCLMLTTMPMWVKLLLSVSVAIYCFYHARNPIAEFSQENSHQWRLVLKDGVSTIAVLEGNSLVTRYLMILNFRCRETHKKYSLCLFPDSFPSKDLQRLRSNIIKR